MTPHAPDSPEHALAVALAADPPDPDAVHAARLAMLAQWERLQWKQANRWWVANQKRGELDDYHAAVRAGWWEAALRFDPSRGNGFAAYAGRYSLKWLSPVAHAEACGLIRLPSHLQGTGYVGPSVRSFGGIEAGGDGGSFDRTLAAPTEERKPDPAGVWAAVCETLEDSRERQVVWMRYGLGASLDEVGKAVGVSKERARQLIAQALETLRAYGERFAEWREDAA